MAKKRVSRRPDSFFKVAGESARKAMSGEVDVDKSCFHRLPDGLTEDERRSYQNKHMRDLYDRMHGPDAHHIELNYPNGPMQFFKDVESGMYDD